MNMWKTFVNQKSHEEAWNNTCISQQEWKGLKNTKECMINM